MSNDLGYHGAVRPTPEPIGLDLTRTGRLLSRAFDEELATLRASLARLRANVGGAGGRTVPDGQE